MSSPQSELTFLLLFTLFRFKTFFLFELFRFKMFCLFDLCRFKKFCLFFLFDICSLNRLLIDKFLNWYRISTSWYCELTDGATFFHATIETNNEKLVLTDCATFLYATIDTNYDKLVVT